MQVIIMAGLALLEALFIFMFVQTCLGTRRWHNLFHAAQAKPLCDHCVERRKKESGTDARE